MESQPQNKAAKIVRALRVKSREGQNDEGHKLVNRVAVEEPADE
jgi:hypothetical protein